MGIHQHAASVVGAATAGGSARSHLCAVRQRPGYQQGGGFKYGKNKKEAAIERKRLFKIIEDLVLWENTTNEDVLKLPAPRSDARGGKFAS